MIAHNNWTEYIWGQHWNVIADIVPKRFDYLSIVAEVVEDRFAIAHAVIEMQKRIVRTLKA